MTSVLNRFQGIDGRRLLIEVLRSQTLIGDDEYLSIEVADAVKLREITNGSSLIQQDASDNELFFILTGDFAILVNGRAVARRGPGQHVGEMALIDPACRRSASVIAISDAVVAEISEASFSAIAERNPRLWRRIANELASRLRQRNVLVPERRERPILFIGSSSEGLFIAQEIQNGLRFDPFTVCVWTNRVFGPSQFPIESLESQIQLSDFAALVVSPDDQVKSRQKDYDAPRDNVVFEVGLFMGALGRRRTFLIKPRDADLKIPTDLLGLVPLDYLNGPRESLTERLAPVCHEIRRIVADLGPK